MRKHEGRRPIEKLWHEYKDNIKNGFLKHLINGSDLIKCGPVTRNTTYIRYASVSWNSISKFNEHLSHYVKLFTLAFTVYGKTDAVHDPKINYKVVAFHCINKKIYFLPCDAVV